MSIFIATLLCGLVHLSNLSPSLEMILAISVDVLLFFDDVLLSWSACDLLIEYNCRALVHTMVIEAVIGCSVSLDTLSLSSCHTHPADLATV